MGDLRAAFRAVLVLAATFTAFSAATSAAAGRPHPLFGNTVLGNSTEILTLWPALSGGQCWVQMRVSDYDSVTAASLVPGTQSAFQGVLPEAQQSDAACGDFDGDGQEDVVWSYIHDMPTPEKFFLWLAVSDMRPGDFYLGDGYNHTEQHGLVYSQPDYYRDPGNIRLAAGNFDSTDAKEFVLVTRDQATDGSRRIRLELMKLDSLTRHPVSLATAWSEEQADGLTESQRFDVAAGDFNNDGVDEIALGGVRGTSSANRQMFLAVFAYQDGQLVQRALGASEVISSSGHIDHVAIATGATGSRLVDQVALTWELTHAYWTQQDCGFCCSAIASHHYFFHITADARLAHLTVNTSGPAWAIQGWSRPREQDGNTYDEGVAYCETWDRATTGTSLGVDVSDLNGDGIAEIVWAAVDEVRVYGVAQDTVLGQVASVEKYRKHNDSSRRIVQVADLDPHPDSALVWRPEIVIKDWNSSPPLGEPGSYRTRLYRAATNTSGHITGLTPLLSSVETLTYQGSSLTMVCGDFDGDAIRLGTPKQLFVNGVIRPEIILGAPPIHYAWLGGQEWDISGCYPGFTCSDFAAHYTKEATVGQAISTAVKMDFGLSTELKGSLEAEVPAVGSAKVETSLKSTFGVNFGRTGAEEMSVEVTTNADAYGGDRVLASQMDYKVWEYPVYTAGRQVMGNIAVVVPDPAGPVRKWYTFDGWLQENQVITHEPGNLLSYPSEVPPNPPNSYLGSLWKAQSVGFQIGPFGSLATIPGSPRETSGSFSLTAADLTTQEQTLGFNTGLELGAKLSVEAGVPFGVVDVKAGMSAEVTGSYHADELLTHTTRVGNEIHLEATLGWLSPDAADATYTVYPFIYRTKSGALVLDYAVTLEGAWWTAHYSGAPDLTLMLPRFYSAEKGYTLTDSTTKYASPDIVVTPPYAAPGDTARVFVMVRNYSLAWQTGPVSMALYVGDPDDGGWPLNDLTGNGTFVISGGIGPRASEMLTVDFVVPPSARDTMRIYAVLDPLGEVAELRDDNNKGYGVLYTSSALSVGAPPARTPWIARLAPNAPNPFTSSTRIQFVVPERARTTLRVFDLAGRRVATLADEVLPAGPHTFRWEGRGDDGRSLSPGVYFYQVRCGTFTGIRRMLMLR